uniref:DUF4201 domain-containing protein n=1 Tax=Caenorhabditis tropicalis TaxID=1561998 RepID=A0A1I7UX08_9PELO
MFDMDIEVKDLGFQKTAQNESSTNEEISVEFDYSEPLDTSAKETTDGFVKVTEELKSEANSKNVKDSPGDESSAEPAYFDYSAPLDVISESVATERRIEEMPYSPPAQAVEQETVDIVVSSGSDRIIPIDWTQGTIEHFKRKISECQKKINALEKSRITTQSLQLIRELTLKICQLDQFWNFLIDEQNECIWFQGLRYDIVEKDWLDLGKKDVPQLMQQLEIYNKELQIRMENVSRVELRRMSFVKENHPATERAAEMMTTLTRQIKLARGLISCFRRHTMDLKTSGRLVGQGRKIRQPAEGVIITGIEGFAEGSRVPVLKTENPLEWEIERNGRIRNVPSVYIQLKNDRTRMTSPIRSPPQSPSLVTIASTLTSE